MQGLLALDTRVRPRQHRPTNADQQGRLPDQGAAQQALQEVVRTLLVDVGVHSITVGEYLDTWLTGKHTLKPKTVSLYRDMANNYLIPHLGDVKLLELRAPHLDRMYAAITMGMRGRPLSPARSVECTRCFARRSTPRSSAD